MLKCPHGVSTTHTQLSISITPGKLVDFGRLSSAHGLFLLSVGIIEYTNSPLGIPDAFSANQELQTHIFSLRHLFGEGNSRLVKFHTVSFSLALFPTN